MAQPEVVIWHELECGVYREDLPVWRELAAEYGDPILDVGAGTGRVSLDLVRHGHRVSALDLDPDLLAGLGRHARGLDPAEADRLEVICADARGFDLGARRFALCVVPMQTIQLLGGREGRLAFLRSARAHLRPGGALALAISPDFEEFAWDDGLGAPLPDIIELEGTLYSSQPTAVRVGSGVAVLERLREVVDPHGHRRASEDRIELDLLGPAELIADAARVGLRPVGTREVAETAEHVGSLVVIFGA